MSAPAGEDPNPVKEPRLVWSLRAVDRCDRCGAQAYVSATVEGVPLLFCGHHYRRHEDALRAVATEIVDERERLLLRSTNSI